MINLAPQSGKIQINKRYAGKKQQNDKPLQYNQNDRLSFSANMVDQQLAYTFKHTADDYVGNNEPDKAIYFYKKAINARPDYTSPYYNLGRIYKENKQLSLAIEAYQKLIEIKPNEVEAITLMGECYQKIGDYYTARTAYKRAVKVDPNYDFANRLLKQVENLILERKNPEKAKAIKEQVAQNNLKKALKLVDEHAHKDLTTPLKDLDISFDETDSLSGHKNIAQYENHNKRIVITSDYIWAAPQITASYIVHEAVHAKDRDGLSSVMEEQNAYQASIEFWIAHNDNIKDPELDYAANLYKENPNKLREKVAQTYRSRDSSIAEFSPNHIPREKMGLWSKIKMYLFRVKDNYTNKTIPIN